MSFFTFEEEVDPVDPVDPLVEGAPSGSTRAPPVVKTIEKQKQCSPARNWTFTWHNYPPNWIEVIEAKQGYLSGWIGGEEVCPTTGTPHIQGAIEFSKKNRPMQTLGFASKWFVMKGSMERNREYCSKDGKWKAWGSFVKPEPYKKHLPELRPWQIELKAILDKPPDERTIYWIFCRDGDTGKTTFQKYYISNFPEKKVIISGGKAADAQNQLIEYKKTNKCLPERIFMNLPRSFNKDYLCWHAIESLKDMCFYSGKYEGGMVVGECPHICIFANEMPDFSKLSKDRWKVAEIVNMELVWIEHKPV